MVSLRCETKPQEFVKEALVSWFLDHQNIQPFLGVDLTTFDPYPCIVTPWQIYGNVLDCLKWFREIGLTIIVDEWVCT